MSKFYHLSTNVHSRGKGHSAVAAAAYRSGEVLYDERLGERYDWSKYREKHGDVMASGIALPDGADKKYYDRGTLANALEAAEKTKAGAYKKTAALCREIECSLPHTMSDQQRRELAFKGAESFMQRYKTSVDWSIHAPHPDGNKKNYHVHYLLSTRELGPDGFGQKAELELDGKTKKKRGLGTGKEQIREVRKNWADLVNSELERAGIAERVDHRSLQDQGIDRIPTKHMGAAATAMERRGEQSRIGDENRVTELFNRELAELEWQKTITDAAIDAEKKRIAQKQHAQKKKNRYDYREQKQQRLRAVDQSKARAAKREAAKASLEAEKQAKERIFADKAADKARIFKDQGGRKEKQEDLRRDTERVRDFGSFADELDKTREKEARADKEAARAQEIFGQQEKNIAEGIRLGRIQPPEKAKETKTAKEALAEFERTAERPEPKQAQEKQNAREMLDQFERSAPKPQAPRSVEEKRSFSEAAKEYESPPPVPAPAPNPLPQQRFADVAQQFEKSSSNDNAPAQTQETPQQQKSGQGRDGGGFER